MTNRMPVVVPAIPPKPPQLTLINSSVRPSNSSDPASFELDGEQLALLPSDLAAELSARRGDAWVRGITYAPENHWPAELRDGCDNSSIDLPALSAPAGLALSQTTGGGTVSAGAHAYQVTALNANGESTALAAVTITTTVVGTVTLTWNKDNELTQYNVYGRVAGSVGLLATVGPFDDDQPASYTDTGTPAPGALPPSSNTTAGQGTYTNLAVVTYIPPIFMVQDECSTFGFESRDFKGRALRLLENAVPQALEREFWTGQLAQAKGLPNNWLTNPATVTDLTPATVPSVARGMQILQDALQQTGFGGQGMIHVQAQTAPNLLGSRRVGNLLLDIFDNIIVPGVGYPGTAPGGSIPAAGTAYMYATDLVMTRQEAEGTIFTDSFAEMTDWSQGGRPNTITTRAQKFAAAYFDGAVQVGVKVNLQA